MHGDHYATNFLLISLCTFCQCPLSLNTAINGICMTNSEHNGGIVKKKILIPRCHTVKELCVPSAYGELHWSFIKTVCENRCTMQFGACRLQLLLIPVVKQSAGPR